MNRETLGVIILCVLIFGTMELNPSDPSQTKPAKVVHKMSVESAQDACLNTVRSSMKHPSEVDFDAWNSQTHKIPNDQGYKFVGSLKAMNDLGMKIPRQYYCEHDGKELTVAQVY